MIYGAVKNPRIRLLIPPIVIILCLVLVFPLTAGCGREASNTFIELLNLVPADVASNQSPNFLTLTNYASYYQDFDITFTNFEELAEKIKTNNIIVLVGGSDITGWGRYADRTTIQDEYVGYNIADVDAEIQFGIPPTDGVAAIGRFDPQATENALRNQAEWPSWAVTAYTIEDYRGVTIHSWGSGLETHLQTRLVPPHIDMLGRARPLAITDNNLFYAASVEAVKFMIDASNDDYSSLADLPEYAAIANGLADLKAYSAIMGDAPLANSFIYQLNDNDVSLTEEEKAPLIESAGLKLKNFLTFGSGLGSDEKGFYTAIIIYHRNSADALENVSLLKQRIENVFSSNFGRPWSEMITETDIWAEGNTLLAKLYADSTMLWESWLYDQDTLLFHEE